MDTDVLVVGAGPTGLVLALWLVKAGVKVRIVDAAEGPGETSRAMGVQARTLEFYAQLGFADEVVAKGIEAAEISLRERGQLRGRAAFGQFGKGLSPFPFLLSFPQDEHERLLLAQLEAAGCQVERKTKLEGLLEKGDHVSAVLDRGGVTEIVETKFLCGCDGAHSATRAGLLIGLPGGTYSQIFFVADAEVEGEAADGNIDLCMSGEDFCIVLPLRREKSVRLIGIVPGPTAPTPDPKASQMTFEDVAPAVRRNTGLDIRKVNWFSTYRVHHRVAERFRQGRVFLLGDAAHIHSPVGGQGMNTGIGDAVNLGWKLAAVLRGEALATILDSFEPERMAFAQKLVRTTDRLFQLITNRMWIGTVWRSVVMARLLPLLFRLKGVPRLAFRAISQIEIDYRSSPLSSGALGHLQAGDRLPWIETAAADNFAPLRSRGWQVHVYGTARDAVAALAASYGPPLHVFAWTPVMAAAGFSRNALYLVRPDGYIGLADPKASPAKLAAYLALHGIKMRTA